MQKLTLKNRDTQDTLFFSRLRGQNCHFSSDTEPGHGPSGLGGDLRDYLWFPRTEDRIHLFCPIWGSPVPPRRRRNGAGNRRPSGAEEARPEPTLTGGES